MDDRITLYGSFTSSSTYKPMLFLALSGLPFSFRTVNLKTGRNKLPDYLAINRYGLVPALRHRGLTIVQSNVILDYLARVTGKFEGASEQDRWQAREWLSWEADAIQNRLNADVVERRAAEDRLQLAIDRRLPQRDLKSLGRDLFLVPLPSLLQETLPSRYHVIDGPVVLGWCQFSPVDRGLVIEDLDLHAGVSNIAF